MLDVTLSKSGGWSSTGILQSELHTKPSTQAQPLAMSSLHPKSVHMSWPLGQRKRIERLSSTRASATEALSSFVAGLADRCPDHTAIPLLRNHRLTNSSVHRDKGGSWLVLPFNYTWSRARFAATINTVTVRWRFVLTPELYSHFRVRLGWKLGGRHLEKLVRKLCSEDKHSWRLVGEEGG